MAWAVGWGSNIFSNGYFVNDKKRLSILNKSLLADEGLSVIGLVRESKSIWFIRGDEKDQGDTLWVEASFQEVQEYQRTGQKDFLKENMAE